MHVYVAGISAKADAHYPGRSVGLPTGYHRREAVGRAGRSQQRAYYCGKPAGRPEHEVKDHTLFSMYEEDTDSMTEMSDSRPEGTARNAGVGHMNQAYPAKYFESLRLIRLTNHHLKLSMTS